MDWYRSNYYIEDEELSDPDTLFLKAKSSIQKLIDLYYTVNPKQKDINTLNEIYTSLDRMHEECDIDTVVLEEDNSYDD